MATPIGKPNFAHMSPLQSRPVACAGACRSLLFPSAAGRAVETRIALLPLAIDGERLQVRQGPPGLGSHTVALLQELGYSDEQVTHLVAQGVVRKATPCRAGSGAGE